MTDLPTAITTRLHGTYVRSGTSNTYRTQDGLTATLTVTATSLQLADARGIVLLIIGGRA